MNRSCASLGSRAAVLAVACVLGPAPPATAFETAGGGVFGLLRERSECCGPAGPRSVVAAGLAGPAAGVSPGGGSRAAGPHLAQATSKPERPPQDGKPPAPPASDAPAEHVTVPLTLPEDAADSFEGSVKPAGPDLTTSEEQDLIKRGWD